MSAYIVNVPAAAEGGTRTKLSQNLRLVDIKPKLCHPDGLQPRSKNIVWLQTSEHGAKLPRGLFQYHVPFVGMYLSAATLDRSSR